MSPPWKGDVLTAWPRSLILLSFGTAAPLFFFCSSSPSRARTCNNSVNSRVLYHWAIEDYVFSRFFVLDSVTKLRFVTWRQDHFPLRGPLLVACHTFKTEYWNLSSHLLQTLLTVFDLSLLTWSFHIDHTLTTSWWFLFCNKLRLLPGGKITSHFRGPLLVAKDKPSTY